MELCGKVFDFLGDSITEGVGTSGADKLFHQLIKEKYNMKYAYNYGVSGTRLARQTVPSADWTTKDLYFELRSDIMYREADAVVVFGGTNDFGHGDAHFGNIDDKDIHTFCGAVNSLITKLQTEFKKAELVFVTPLRRLGEDIPDTPDGKTLANYANAIKQICAKRDVKVIDLFEINPLNPEDASLVPDGLHPNDDGHKILAKVLGEQLEKL